MPGWTPKVVVCVSQPSRVCLVGNLVDSDFAGGPVPFRSSRASLVVYSCTQSGVRNETSYVRVVQGNTTPYICWVHSISTGLNSQLHNISAEPNSQR